MVFYLEFENSSIGKLSEVQIDSFSYVCNIFKLYAGAKIVIKDFAKKTNNLIKSGMPVNVVFTDNDKKSYVNRMRILSFTKVPEPQTNFTDYLEITLVSAMYFDNIISSSAHKGTVSNIIEEIISKNFSNSVKEYKITQTDDLIRRRYQLEERSQDFMQRICKYGIKNKLPVYLFFDSKGILNLASVDDMIKSEPKYVANTVLADQTFQIPADNESLSKITFFDFQLLNSGKNANTIINSIFTTDNFRHSTAIVGSLTYSSAEYNNSQASEESPTKTVFYNWNLAPSDAYSIAARKSFEDTIYTYSLSASFNGFMVDELMLGSVIYIILPFTPTETSSKGAKINLGEGKYMVTQLSYLYENNMLTTNATFVQVAS